VVGLPLEADIPLIGKFHEPVPLLTFDGGKIARFVTVLSQSARISDSARGSLGPLILISCGLATLFTLRPRH
jgi:hypothetical protein